MPDLKARVSVDLALASILWNFPLFFWISICTFFDVLYQLPTRPLDVLRTTGHGNGTSWKIQKLPGTGRCLRLLRRPVMEPPGAPRDVPIISPNIGPSGTDSQLRPRPSLPGCLSVGSTLGRAAPHDSREDLPFQFLASDVPLHP